MAPTTETIIARMQKLGLKTDELPVNTVESATAALACFPMYMVANVHLWTSDKQFQLPVIDFPGSEAIREAFAIGRQERNLPLERSHRRVLSKHLTANKRSDRIIYEYALETLQMYLELASDDVVEQFRTAIARMIVAVAGASGEGLLGSGEKVSDEEQACIQQITNALDLTSSPGAVQALNAIG